jgi:hypothetical protein
MANGQEDKVDKVLKDCEIKIGNRDIPFRTVTHAN